MLGVPGPWGSITWKRPANIGLDGLGPLASTFSINVTSPVNSLRAAVEAFGEPIVDGTPLQALCTLLHAACEVEHAVLVEYLYAAYSVSDPSLQERIKNVAIQEMSHFLTVQNLLLFAGAEPSIRRQDQDPKAAKDAFQFSLRPFSKTVLEDFILAEMPQLGALSCAQRRILEPLIKERTTTGRSVHRIGLLYAKIYWLLQQDDQPTADWPEVALAGFEPNKHVHDFPGAATINTFQLDPSTEVGWPQSDPHEGIFATVGTPSEARNVVRAIASQGEGLVAPHDNKSHFLTYLDIYTSTDFDSLPATNWPTDPFASDQPAGDQTREPSRITNPDALTLCALLDKRYQIALTCIRAAFSRNKSNLTDQPVRKKYLKWLFDEMLSTIKPLSLGLADFPLKPPDSKSTLVAAPTFAIEGFDLPNDAVALDATMKTLHEAAARLIADAQARIQSADMQRLLGTIKFIDSKRYPNLIA